ncbi:hypothetical protein AXE65_05560 [Ventosimonas gracilis]|uniref:Stage II sporulation protein M n=1 Tax=Ventosimonas gracilis TaxID=1680762 RepID=A0A139SNS4_9GAMM|nr:stage II sporulation protein M [Ventosimonas gracilis]KXU36120.1 hypothetical protein AXE65_05560 [Ventosimonas gracilis]
MKQSQFESRYQSRWQQFAEQLEVLEGAKKSQKDKKQAVKADEGFISAYRALCQQLALSTERGYSRHLIDQLQQLALRGHQQLYRHKSTLGVQLLRFVLVGFPQRVRQEWRFVLAACLLLFGSMLGMGILTYLFPSLLELLASPEQIAQFEQMYNPADPRFGKVGTREAATNWGMFAHYIENNIGIAFQTFASGVLFCIGSLFYLLFNGIYIGAIAGYLTQIGSGAPFWSFVAAHSSFELTAIAISGAAGLRLGMALLAPGRLLRGEALRLAGRSAVGLIGGATLFLLLAAFIEAYWSPTILPWLWVKYLFGIFLWLLMLAYLCLAGRGMETADAFD